ncbi:MAG: hypothetical protein GYB31_01795 [Bacteroidetes bacterium]|nr:hypothetical protein [Bacteroidota bacterium]
MEDSRLYMFSLDFFQCQSSIRQFIKQAYETINEKKSNESKSKEALIQVLLVHQLSKKTSDKSSLQILKLTEANLLRLFGYLNEDLASLRKAYFLTKDINEDILEPDLLNGYYLVKGQVCLQYYILLLNEEQIDNSKINSLKFLLEAKKYFSFLIKKLQNGEIPKNIRNTNTLILQYCQSLGYLSRYVEPFYLLQNLEKNTTSLHESIALARIQLLEAINEKTCNHTNPLSLILIKDYALKALKSKNIDKRNIPILKEKINSIKSTIGHYCKKYNTNTKTLRKTLHQNQKKILTYKNYQKFILCNMLSLNEHSIFCNCKEALNDNLKIESGCNHTKNNLNSSPQLLLDKLKVEFDSARQNYYRATDSNGKKKLYKKHFKAAIAHSGILNTPSSQELINAFKTCFSILDKIALGVNSIHRIITSENKIKQINFTKFFNQRITRNKINTEPNNLYLLALYSLSLDLNKETQGEFSDYKEWRNAMEHDQFYLVSDDAKISALELDFPDSKFLIKRSEFIEKTLFMLHICRSAIFTYTWAVRKASKSWKNEAS